MKARHTACISNSESLEIMTAMLSQSRQYRCKYTRGRGTCHGDEIHGVHAKR